MAQWNVLVKTKREITRRKPQRKRQRCELGRDVFVLRQRFQKLYLRLARFIEGKNKEKNCLREVRDILLVSHSGNINNGEEFCLLYDFNKSSKLDLPYWICSKFDLDTVNDGEFRFFRNDVYRLGEILNIPEELVRYNGVVCDKYEALCISCKKIRIPCHFLDIIPRFGRR